MPETSPVDGELTQGRLCVMWGFNITELGCWAHARRNFFAARAASGSPVTKEAVARIGEIYAHDGALTEPDPEARHRKGQRLLEPRRAALKHWLDELQPKLLGNTGLAGAISYRQKRWDALARVVDDGRYLIDDSPAENTDMRGAISSGA